jgi:hypothetical protein
MQPPCLRTAPSLSLSYAKIPRATGPAAGPFFDVDLRGRAGRSSFDVRASPVINHQTREGHHTKLGRSARRGSSNLRVGRQQ